MSAAARLWPPCLPADAQQGLHTIGPVDVSSLITVLPSGRAVEPTEQQSLGVLEEVFKVRSSSTMPSACRLHPLHTHWLAGWLGHVCCMRSSSNGTNRLQDTRMLLRAHLQLCWAVLCA